MSLYQMILRKLKTVKKLNSLQALREERGAVFVLTALLLPVLIGCLGFAYDAGNLYMHKARLQNVTDAAALAGGAVFGEKAQGTDSRRGNTITLTGKHKDADDVAKDYVNKNKINLGNNILVEELSALGYQGDVDENATTGVKTQSTDVYYRVIASEQVPLYFLPIIFDKREQTVRAVSVALTKTTKTTTPGSDQENDGNPPTVPNRSIFNNLFTYSEYFDAGLTNANNEVAATFDGNMVFTYGNGAGSAEDYYNIDKIINNTTQSVDHLYSDDTDAHLFLPSMREHPSSTADTEWAKVNDPTINTYFDTTAYLDVFRQKLLGPHVDVTGQHLYLTSGNGEGTVNTGCIGTGPEGKQYWLFNEYYPLDNGSRVSFVNDYKLYYVCYHNLNGKCLRVAVNDEEKVLRLVNDNNEFTGYTIGSKTVNEGGWIHDVEIIVNATGNEDSGGYNSLNIKSYSPEQFNFNISSGTTKSNVYHVTQQIADKYNTNYSFAVHVGSIEADSTDSNTPIIVIVDDSPKGTVKLYAETSNKRPVVFVYFGKTNINLEYGENSKSTDDYNLTIYAPYASVGYSPDIEPIHLNAVFHGNIIAKRIGIQASGYSGEWHVKNHLANDAGVQVVDQKIEAEIRKQNIPDNVKTAIANAYASVFGVDAKDLKDALFRDKEESAEATKQRKAANELSYSKLSYANKQALYTAWKGLVADYPAYKDMLWPWNEHFDLDLTTTVTPGQPTTTSESTLRLINPRTENNPYFTSSSDI